MTPQETTILAVKLLFALVALAAVGWFVVRPIWHMLRRMEEVEQAIKPFEPPPEEELQIPVDELRAGGKPDRQQMMEMVRSDPRRAAMVMQGWLREKKAQRGSKPVSTKEK